MKTVEFDHPIGGDLYKSSIKNRKRALVINCYENYTGIIGTLFNRELNFDCRCIDYSTGIPNKISILEGLKWLFTGVLNGDITVFYFAGDSATNINGDISLLIPDGTSIKWSIIMKTMIELSKYNNLTILNILDISSGITCGKLPYEYIYENNKIIEYVHVNDFDYKPLGIICLGLKGNIEKKNVWLLSGLLIEIWKSKNLRLNLEDVLIYIGEKLDSKKYNQNIVLYTGKSVDLRRFYLAISH